jgi:hypothetical protein
MSGSMIVPRRRWTALSALAVVLFLLGAASASAQSLDRDYVTGDSGGELIPTPHAGSFRIIQVFDVSSDPAGGGPTGTVRIDVDNTVFGRQTFATYEVTCLAVAGNRATIGGVAIGGSSPFPANITFAIEDGVGGAPDRAGFTPAPAPPTTCPPFASPAASVTGALTVHDALEVPSSPRQCFAGGWQQYGFESLGRCLAFVFKSRLCEFLERLGHHPGFCPPTPPASMRRPGP